LALYYAAECGSRDFNIISTEEVGQLANDNCFETEATGPFELVAGSRHGWDHEEEGPWNPLLEAIRTEAGTFYTA